jgi:peptidylprolyl isomerase
MFRRSLPVTALAAWSLAAAAPQAAEAAAPQSLDAELARIVALLPGRYAGSAPAPASSGGGDRPLSHRIVPIDAPRFGELVFYHEISRDGFYTRRPLQQKIYAFDTRPGRRRNSMRSWVVPYGTVMPAPDRDAQTLAGLSPARLQSFPAGCELRWTASSTAGEYIAGVRREDCRFRSATFRQWVRPAMRYTLSARRFVLQDVIYGENGAPLFADPGPLLADRVRTMAEVLAASQPADWRRPDPAHTLYLELDSGRVVIELAPGFAPRSVANLLTLVRAAYFDGLAINRVQDDFVVQWGDPEGKRPLGAAVAKIAPEFSRRWSTDLPVTLLPDADAYAPQTGFADGLPVAGDRARGEIWPAHCYGAVGLGRDLDLDSGNGSELYVVIGQPPRQLDRNIALVGRVVHGIERLSGLPRGTGPLGFYERPEQRVPIRRIRVAADLPESERAPIELLRTDTQTFADLVESRRNRLDDFYFRAAGHIDLCAIPLPARTVEAAR